MTATALCLACLFGGIFAGMKIEAWFNRVEKRLVNRINELRKVQDSPTLPEETQ